MNARAPSVSIVIPVYNGGKTLDMCLNSLLQQDYPRDAYEIIVVENCSTDNTVEVASKYPVRLIQSSKRGPAPARNLGITSSNAEIVALTDADCIADPSWLSNLIAPYSDPEIGGTGGPIHAYVESNRSIVELFSEAFPPLVNFSKGSHEFLPSLFTSNCSYRRDLLLQIGCLNERLVTGDDVDVSWRMQLETGKKVALAEDAIIYHRHRQTLTGLKRQYWQYGFGEVLLDTIYGQRAGYPRPRSFTIRRTLGQVAILPRYVASAGLRQIRYRRGKITRYEAAVPALWLLIEGSCILGKLDALIATRGMRNVNGLLKADNEHVLDRLYQS